MNGRKTNRDNAIRAKETKLESIPVRFPLISPKENPQARETSNNIHIYLPQIKRSGCNKYYRIFMLNN
jgi:hypothetical protein